MDTIPLLPDFLDLLRFLSDESVIHLEDLRRNKSTAGRAKDQADLENLPETG
jgi:hypothetical protein